tara:strand:+ start:312 stop:659 length:348 start_codon:yes stop_codon:yes gene_type:complete
MIINTKKIEEIIRQSIISVSSNTTPWLNESTTIGEVDGVQVQILVTSEEDEFTDEISENYRCIDSEQRTPELGANCVIWRGDKPSIDNLTDEDHHEPYWAESLCSFGDEDKFIVL